MKFFKKKSVPIVTPELITETNERNGSRALSIRNRSDTIVDVPPSANVINTPKRNFCQQCCTTENLKEQALLLATISSVVLGVIVGVSLRSLKCATGKDKQNLGI